MILFLKKVFYFVPCYIFIFYIFSCDPYMDKNKSILSEEENVAVVNNQKISLSLFQQRFEEFSNKYSNLLVNNEQNIRKLKEYIVHKIVEDILLLQEAYRRGITVSEDELNTLTTNALNPYPGAKFNQKLKHLKISLEDWKDKYHNTLLIKKLIKQEVNDKITVTKAEIWNYFTKNKSKFYIPKQHHVRHILVNSLDETQVILSQLKRGVSFKKMVQEHSIAPDKVVEGDMGFVTKGVLPVPMDKAIFKLRYPKQLSNIAYTEKGYHIFQLQKIKPAQKPRYSRLKQKIKHILVTQKQDEAYSKWLIRLKTHATISIDRSILHSDEGF